MKLPKWRQHSGASSPPPKSLGVSGELPSLSHTLRLFPVSSRLDRLPPSPPTSLSLSVESSHSTKSPTPRRSSVSSRLGSAARVRPLVARLPGARSTAAGVRRRPSLLRKAPAVAAVRARLKARHRRSCYCSSGVAASSR